MLELWMGRANTGKSSAVLEQIKLLGNKGRDQILLVPEHATHQAELDVCRLCGDGASRYCEVLSFRQLARRVMERTGGLSDVPLDAGGKLLTMQLALGQVLRELKVYARPSRKAQFLAELVELCDELLAFRIQPEQMAQASEALEGGSGDKVRDISLIYAAYLQLLARDGQDRRDLMTRLTQQLEQSHYIDGKDIYLDGFSYFTAQEEQIISLLLRRANSVTVTVLGEENSALEIFQQGIRTQKNLEHLAGDLGLGCKVINFNRKENTTAIEHIESCFFGKNALWNGGAETVALFRADNIFSEVEYVAARILELVREDGYRFRDIYVAARNLEEYAPVLESVFERFGIPLYLSQRSDVLEKPVLSLIAGVLDAVTGGFEYEDMFRWLKTGLAGISDEECDKLENYVIQWDIHGSMWLHSDDWTANPDGWQEGFTADQQSRLDEINALRRRIAQPMGRLDMALREREGARGKLRALWEFLEEICLAQLLEERTARLEELGQLQQATEYSQLWEILCGVMDQFAEILDETPLDREEFARLFKLLLTQYDVATIPVSLDQVQVSQITRNDRHQVKCLFLMGANDHVLPAVQSGIGLLSREDREQLLDQQIRLAPHGMELFHVELQNLYAALVQPTDRLTVTWPASNLNGDSLRPSFVIGRIKALLPGVNITTETPGHLDRLSSPSPALEMAAGQQGGALWDYFSAREEYTCRLEGMERAAAMKRGHLSQSAVEALYGSSYRMSASRIDKISSCHFAYFMRYGLRAKERTGAGFDAAQVGTFLHYVLEHVTKEAMARDGFAALEEGELEKIIARVIEQYMASAMPGFESRDARFRYLFHRLKKAVTTIVENVAAELSQSDFRPVAFELDFSGGGDLPAISIHAEDASLTVVGKVDRVDGWLKDGKLYLRVVDYKSGKKAFDLSDVYHGLNIQMLLYLFALQREGKAYFGQEILPAGVLYLPARDVLISTKRSTGEEDLRTAMEKELRRSGLVLGQPEVLQAMEHSALDSPRYLPLTLGRDGSITKGIATAEELGKLGRYVDKLLERIALELKNGNIDADPCGRGEDDNACTYCEFAAACHFMEADAGDHMKMIRPVSPADFWQHVDNVIGKEEQI